MKHVRETLEGRNGKTASANAGYSIDIFLSVVLLMLRFVVLSLSILLGRQYVV